MAAWTVGEIAALRAARRQHPMEVLVRLFPNKSRDEIVEGIDSVLRNDSDHDAQRAANYCCTARRAAVPMINGKPDHVVLRRHHQPMF